MVQAKFRVGKIDRTMGTRRSKDAHGLPIKDERGYDRYEPAELWTVILNPVSAMAGEPHHENTKFWDASPSGEIRLGTVNRAAVEQFDLNKEFYVTFTATDEGVSR